MELFQVLSLYFLFLASNASTSSLDAKIIGGEETNAGEYSCVAAIYVQTNDSKFFCGGAVVDQSWILTSAHCVNNAVLFTIQVGSNTLEGEDPNRVTVATSEYIQHPEFDPTTLANDIALIKLRMPLTFGTYLSRCFFSTFDIHPSDRVILVGWGQVDDSQSELSNILREVRITALSNSECKSYYGEQINDNMVCVGGNYNEGACVGDTGSPLIDPKFWPYINGIASFISGNGCESTDPSGYTRIGPYKDWINEIMSN